MGKTPQGHFSAAPLKRYPRGLCEGVAELRKNGCAKVRHQTAESDAYMETFEISRMSAWRAQRIFAAMEPTMSPKKCQLPNACGRVLILDSSSHESIYTYIYIYVYTYIYIYYIYLYNIYIIHIIYKLYIILYYIILYYIIFCCIVLYYITLDYIKFVLYYIKLFLWYYIMLFLWYYIFLYYFILDYFDYIK